MPTVGGSRIEPLHGHGWLALQNNGSVSASSALNWFWIADAHHDGSRSADGIAFDKLFSNGGAEVSALPAITEAVVARSTPRDQGGGGVSAKAGTGL